MTITTKFEVDEEVNIKDAHFGIIRAKIVDIGITIYNAHKTVVIIYKVFYNIGDYCDHLVINEAALLRINNK